MKMGVLIKTPPQMLRKIWALAREISITEEDLRAIVQQVTGQSSLSGLTKPQASLIIDRLNEYAGKTQPRPRNRLSKAQRWKIKELEKALGWDDEPKRLSGFIKKFYKVDRIEWLTPQAAGRLIESLKKMAEREALESPSEAQN
ncbi:regulatory protein GemA [Brevibacillus agri]|uniref:regulatory protein GemA n=1 Tax=Brevibacillus agri TaxID=51101 RepID=UPI003D1DC3C6